MSQNIPTPTLVELIEKYAEAYSVHGSHNYSEETTKARKAMLSSLESITHTLTPTDTQVTAITAAYEQGVGSGQKAVSSGQEVDNPYTDGWNCRLAWDRGYSAGKIQMAINEQGGISIDLKDLSEKIDDYAESRHVNGTHLYNARTAEKRSSLLIWISDLFDLRRKAKGSK